MRPLILLLLGALALPSNAQELPGGPSSAPGVGASSQPASQDGSRERIDALISALGPVFKRCKTKRLRALMKSGSVDASVFGLAVLLCGKPQRALRYLSDKDPDLPTYRAMAKMTASGGLARARSVLAKASRQKNVPAGALFLASLAFYDSGQPEQAHTLLKRALKAAPSALDEAFAPDPAVGLARAARRALKRMGAKPKDELRIATMLMRSGRRAEAHRWAKRASGPEQARLLMRLYAKAQPRRALEHAERLSELRPEDREAAATQIELLVLRKEFDRARTRLNDLGAVSGRGAQAAKLQRAKAAIALHEDAAAEALEAAERAARLQPRSDRAAELLTRALLLSGELARAYAFAQELHRRRPIRIDPFGLMASIQEKRGLTRKVPALRLRSQGHREARAKLQRELQRRARVIEAVRSAEAGLGITGLDAVRTKDPMMSLTVDLALAKLGPAGTARAARDRLLATCRRKLSMLLSNRRGWDRVMVSLSPYGKNQEVSGPLLAADPGRCGTTLGFRRIKP